MKKKIEFTAYERRVFGLPQGEEIRGKDAEALRKVIDAFPWICTAADFRFDDGVSKACLVAAAMSIQAANHIQAAIDKAGKIKRKSNKSTTQGE